MQNQAISNPQTASVSPGQSMDQQRLNRQYAEDVAQSNQLLPGPNYFDRLQKLHDLLRPRTYVEIGVQRGNSLALANPDTKVIGIDPNLQINNSIRAWTKLFNVESDTFFANHKLETEFGTDIVDFAFIDGLHTFDQALRDFINLEKHTGPNSIFLFHDIYPINEHTSLRDRKSVFWTGDTWKVVKLLVDTRPDLKILTIKTQPSGLMLVGNMNKHSTVLDENFDQLVQGYGQQDYNSYRAVRDTLANPVENDWDRIEATIRSNFPEAIENADTSHKALFSNLCSDILQSV